jgi:hypothetical protein
MEHAMHPATSTAAPLPLAPPIVDPAAIPPLRVIPSPTITVGLPDGGQAQIPGTLWPAPDLWAASERRARAGAPPAIEIRQLTRRESNVLAAAWHPLGEETRPFGYHAFALFVEGEPLALATAGSAHSASVDKELGLFRANTIELTRLCRASEQTHPQAKGTLRVMLRLWRDFLAVPYWPYYKDTEKIALISYSLPGKAGHTYIHDGWRRARGCRSWGGGATWSRAPRAGAAPQALFVYWLAGTRPPHVDQVLARRDRQSQLRGTGPVGPDPVDGARRAA